MDVSEWIARFATLVPEGGTVLDVACGQGRHTRFFLDRGHPVVAVDVDVGGVEDLRGQAGLTIVDADLEDGRAVSFAGQRYAAVVVAAYLHRPLLPALVDAVDEGGLLLYETFARGHERFGRPTNPDFLLRPGELLEVARGHLRVVAYEDVVVSHPRPAGVQRLCARRERP